MTCNAAICPVSPSSLGRATSRIGLAGLALAIALIAARSADAQDAGVLAPPVLEPQDGGADAALQSATDTNMELTPEQHGLSCDGAGPCVIVQTEKQLRVLPRSQSALYAAPSADAAVVKSSVVAFQPLYVFGLEQLNLADPAAPEGFYQVGASAGAAEGFLHAQDTLEWRQAMVLEFEHPGQGEDRRLPTLFFRQLSDLLAIVRAPDRSEKVAQLREDIASGDTAGGAIAREPAAYADITDDLYVYPILEWRQDEDSEERPRYLRVLTSVPGTRVDPASSPIAQNKVADIAPQKRTLADMDVDVVFVIDMTGSMAPSIDAVATALKVSADEFGREFAGARQVRFGLYGFRDSVERTPDLEYTVKSFTPEGLVTRDGLSAILDNGGANLVASESSDEWAEALLSGVNTAIKDTSWSSDDSLRLLIVVGDASGHEPGHPAYQNGLDSASLRQLASDENIYINGVYIQNGRAELDWSRANQQYGVLTTNPGASAPNFGEVTADAPYMVEVFLTEFAYSSRAFAEQVLAEQEALTPSVVTPAPSQPDPNPMDHGAGSGARVGVNDPRLSDEQRDTVAAIAESWGEGLKLGIVDYLGSGQEAPADFTGWVLDNDLANPNRRAVSVRVLITREELDTVIRRLEFLVQALEEKEISQADFFSTLQDLSARTGLDIDVEESQQFRSSNLLPKWIAAMPYKSEVLDLSPRSFEEMTTQDRGAFIQRNKSKLEAYRAISTKPDGWSKLDPQADDLARVYPLDIDALP